MADVNNKKIILGENRILRLEIFKNENESTNEFLEIDAEDIEFPLRINQAQKEHIKNVNGLKMQLKILEKKEDKKGKYIMSWKDEETIKIYREFYQREMKTIDLMIGEGGCKKLLGGRKPYATMFNEIVKILKEQVSPYLKTNIQEITKYIEEKYSNEDSDVLE